MAETNSRDDETVKEQSFIFEKGKENEALNEEEAVPIIRVEKDEHLVEEDEEDASENDSLLAKTERTPLLEKKEKRGKDFLFEEENVKIYRKRWFMLLLFSLNTLMNGVLMVGLSPVTNLVSKHYGESETLIEWSTNIFLFIYIWFAVPASYLTTKLGVRKALILVAFLNVLSTIFHMPGYHSERFFYYFVGQVPAAIAYSFVLSMPSQISANWFPLYERASSTAIGAFMNTFGCALAYLQSTNIVREAYTEINIEGDVKALFLFQLVVAVIITVLTTAFFVEKPETPPSSINQTQKDFDPNFWESIKVLVKDKNFLLMSQCFGVCTGILYSIVVLINPLFTSKFPVGHVKMIGWLGFTFLIVSYASSSVIAMWIDKANSYRAVSILVNIGSFWIWLLFTVFFLETDSFTVLFVLFTMLGLVGLPYSYLGLEHAVEVTYPIKESTSSVFILIVGNLYSFIFVLVIGELISNGYANVSCYIFLVLYAVSSVLAIMTKTDLKRKQAELKRKLGEF